MTSLDEDARGALEGRLAADVQPDQISDDGVRLPASADHVQDRRRPSAGPRHAWTADPPFERRKPVVSGADTRWGWRRSVRVYRSWLVLTDFLVTVGLVTAAAWLRPATSGQHVGHVGTFLAAIAIGLILVTLTTLTRGYNLLTLGDGAEEYQSILRAGLVTAGIVIAVAYLSELAISRYVVVVALPSVVVLGWVARYCGRRLLHRQRGLGRALMRTVLVGDELTVSKLARQLSKESYHGYEVVGVCLPSYLGQVGGLPPVLGAMSDVPQVVVDHNVDVVVVGAGQLVGEPLQRLTWALGHTDAELVVSPGLVEVLEPRVTVRPTIGLSLLHVETTKPTVRLRLKALVDRIGALALVIALSPVFFFIALAIRLDSRGPAFFKQTRVGEGGRLFTMWKFRSMYVDAEARRAALLEDTDRDGPMFKMHDDPRITRVGRLLRRTSVDELPQLFNVARGEMSLVGPRPPLPSEVDTYRDAVHRRLLVRPGMTGLWQVSGRADLPWAESIQLDLRYVDNWSFAMDAQILWRTVRAVVGGKGAY